MRLGSATAPMPRDGPRRAAGSAHAPLRGRHHCLVPRRQRCSLASHHRCSAGASRRLRLSAPRRNYPARLIGHPPMPGRAPIKPHSLTDPGNQPPPKPATWALAGRCQWARSLRTPVPVASPSKAPAETSSVRKAATNRKFPNKAGRPSTFRTGLAGHGCAGNRFNKCELAADVGGVCL